MHHRIFSSTSLIQLFPLSLSLQRFSMTSSDSPFDSESGSPIPRPRWFHAQGKDWVLFTEKDDEKLESKFQELGGQNWSNEVQEESSLNQDQDKEEQNLSKEKPIEVEQDSNSNEDEEEEKENQLDDSNPLKDSNKSSVEKSKSSFNEWIPDSISPSVSGNVTPSKDSPKKSSKPSNPVVNYLLDPSEPSNSPSRVTKVPVLEDNLFEVDLEKWQLYPVFWKGVALKVVRATWFYSSKTDGSYAPIKSESKLSRDLERCYEEVKPWTEIYRRRIGGLVDEDGDGKVDDKDKLLAKEKFMVNLKVKDEMKDGKSEGEGEGDGDEEGYTDGEIFFESSTKARIFTKDWRGRLMSVLGGNLVVRGFDQAEKSQKEKSDHPFGRPDFKLPWAGGDEVEENQEFEEEEEDGNGNTHSRSSRRAGRKAGAAKIPKKPKAQGDDEGEEKNGNLSFASKLWPSSDVLMKPGYAALKMLGWSSQDAKDEQKRKEKQGATEEALEGEGRGSKGKKKGGNKIDGGEDDETETDEDGEEILEDLKDSPPELCLCIHGIGQQLSEDFDALNFVYDVQRLRNLSATQADDPSIRKLSRGRRVQFLPICWRGKLSFDEEPEENDNYFNLGDVSNDAAIPLVRNVISKVILDVPFYLSNHRAKMIDAVKAELNRIYRLFCVRNPEFEEKGGRVSLICHSLGSALASDILSSQPTTVKPLKDLTSRELEDNSGLLFNVKDTFFIGSPIGFFYYLESVQLIARSGNKRTSKDNTKEEFREDSMMDQVGRKGCLATETIYNIYNTTDPVAYKLSPTCDSIYSKMLRPVQISSAVSSILEALDKPKLSVSNVFKKFGDHPFGGVGSFGMEEEKELEENSLQIDKEEEMEETDEDEEEEEEEEKESEETQDVKKKAKSKTSLTLERGSSLKQRQAQAAARELRKKAWKEGVKPPQEWNSDSMARAERRFRALNPHGVLDFTIEADDFLGGYVEMLGAHVSYWTSSTFSTFLLSQLFLRMDENKDVQRDGEEMLSVVPELKTGKAKEGDEKEEKRQEEEKKKKKEED